MRMVLAGVVGFGLLGSAAVAQGKVTVAPPAVGPMVGKDRAAGPLLPPLESAEAGAERIFQRTGSTGMVIVAVREGEVWFGSFGQTAAGSGVKPGADSLVRLCSLTKILTTDVLVKMVAAGTVKFSDPLQMFAPAGVTVPAMTVRGPALRAITLGDLATHTAGLPREIAYPPPGAAHFTFPDYRFRWDWLPGYRLRTSPGTAAHYSNVGFDLLADALSKAAGKSYPALFEQETAGPLGLRDTTLEPTPDECARLMSGAREPADCTSTVASAGSGGMYSTGRDMARVLEYFLGLPGVPVHQNGYSTAVYIQPDQLKSMQGLGHAGVPTGLGLGWVEINREYGDARIVQKTGGGAGFQSYIALDPARHAGVFVAITQGRGRGGTNMFRDANDLLLGLVGLAPVPVDLNDPERERTAAETSEAGKAPVRVEGRRTGAGKRRVAARAAVLRTRAGTKRRVVSRERGKR